MLSVGATSFKFHGKEKSWDGGGGWAYLSHAVHIWRLPWLAIEMASVSSGWAGWAISHPGTLGSFSVRMSIHWSESPDY